MFDTQGYRPRRTRRSFPVAGRSGIATIKRPTGQYARRRQFISAARFPYLGLLIAEVVCGGQVDAGTLVTEEYLMALERKALLRRLLDTPQDPGTHHGHDVHRQAGAQLNGDTDMKTAVFNVKRAERRAAPKPARIPSGDRPMYSSDEGQS